MKKLFDKIKLFMELPAFKRRLVYRVAYWLFVAKIINKILPFRKIAQFLGEQTPPNNLSCELSYLQKCYLENVESFLPKVSRVLPWRSTCLVKAVAAAQVLKKCHIPYTVFFGVDVEGGKLSAHAWLCVGEVIVTGEGDAGKYKTIISFSRSF